MRQDNQPDGTSERTGGRRGKRIDTRPDRQNAQNKQHTTEAGRWLDGLKERMGWLGEQTEEDGRKPTGRGGGKTDVRKGWRTHDGRREATSEHMGEEAGRPGGPEQAKGRGNITTAMINTASQPHTGG